MQKRDEVFDIMEAMECKTEKTGEFRTRQRKLDYSPDADPNSAASEGVREERVIWWHPDGRVAESWENRE